MNYSTKKHPITTVNKVTQSDTNKLKPNEILRYSMTEIIKKKKNALGNSYLRLINKSVSPFNYQYYN